MQAWLFWYLCFAAGGFAALGLALVRDHGERLSCAEPPVQAAVLLALLGAAMAWPLTVALTLWARSQRSGEP